jgi:hypothetical protein
MRQLSFSTMTMIPAHESYPGVLSRESILYSSEELRGGKMSEDPIVANIRRSRAEYAASHGHDLGRICAALRETEAKSTRQVVQCRKIPLSSGR